MVWGVNWSDDGYWCLLTDGKDFEFGVVCVRGETFFCGLDEDLGVCDLSHFEQLQTVDK